MRGVGVNPGLATEPNAGQPAASRPVGFYAEISGNIGQFQAICPHFPASGKLPWHFFGLGRK